MLVELKVKDFAIIDELKIQFREGLNILSGETGAGKSVLLKSLSLLMGGKASTDIVRTGSKQAVIEGLFEISEREDIKKQLRELEIDYEEDQLIVRRIITSNAKSKIYINSSLCTLSNLNQIVCPLIQLTGQSAPLIEITGQHDSKNLLDRSYHIDILDHFSENLKLRDKFVDLHQEFKAISFELENLKNNQLAQEQKLDFLAFQKKEIESLHLQDGEEDQLENRYHSLKNAQKLISFKQNSENLLVDDDDSALARLEKIHQLLIDNSKYDKDLSKFEPNLRQSIDLLKEYTYDLRNYGENLLDSDENIADLEDRLSRFRKLQKKYGDSSTEILAFLDGIKQEIGKLENSDAHIENLTKLKKQKHLELTAIAQQMHEIRKSQALSMEKQVNWELADLNMKGLEFFVQVEKLEEIQSHGMSRVEFFCRTNKKEEKRALNKTASGGELSRILLALKKVIGASELPRTYLFDEVDTGVSGETAEKVGKKLREIGQGQQVICVTHLPQVAAQGDFHFYIEKSSKNGRAVMHLTELKKDDRIKEIARLISGEKISKTSLSHAKELLNLSI